MNLVVHYCTVRKKYATLPYLQPSCITYARCTILKWMSLSDDDDSDREDDEEEEEEENLTPSALAMHIRNELASQFHAKM